MSSVSGRHCPVFSFQMLIQFSFAKFTIFLPFFLIAYHGVCSDAYLIYDRKIRLYF